MRHGIQWCFLDIGGTLGTVAQHPLKLIPFATSNSLLSNLKNVLRLKLGVITNVPGTIAKSDVMNLLADADLMKYFDPLGIITSTDAHAMKPQIEIYQFAASTVGAAL